MEPAAVATQNGLANAMHLVAAADLAGVGYGVAFALAEQESGGRNIYGHDRGGALSTADGGVTVCGQSFSKGTTIPVTPCNAAVFLMMVASGHTSNGIGPAQITFPGYFPFMLQRGLLPWDAVDNFRFGLETLRSHKNKGNTWKDAGTAYNGSTTYGIELAAKIKVWRARLRAA